MRRLWLIIALPLLCLLLLYAALPTLTEYSIRNTLTAYGVDTRQFTVSHPGWNQVTVTELQLQQNTDQQQLDLKIRDATAHFDLWQLLSKQHIESLSIESLQLRLEQRSAATSSTDLPLILPSELFGQLPAQTLSLSNYDIEVLSDRQAVKLSGYASIENGRFITDIASPDLPGYSARLMINESNQLLSSLKQQDRSIVDVDIRLSASDSLLAKITANIATQPLQQLAAQPLMQQLAIPLPAKLQSISGPIRISGASSFTLPLTNAGLRYHGTHRYNAEGDIALQQPRPELSAVQSRFRAELSLKQQQLDVNITQLDSNISQITIAGEQPLAISQVRLQARKPIQLSSVYSPDTDILKHLSLAPAEFSIAGSPLYSDQQAQPRLTINYEPVTLVVNKVDPFARTLSGSLASNRIELQSTDLTLPPFSLNTRIKLTPEQLSNRFNITLLDNLLPDGKFTISGRSKTELNSLHTSANWKTEPLQLQGIEKLAQRYLPGLPPELNIYRGVLNHQGWLDLTTDSYALRFLNKATNTDLSYDQTRFFDINWGSETVQSHSGKLEDKGTIDIGFIDAGAPLQDFTGRYRIQQSNSGSPQVSLDSSTVKALGGEITTLPVSFNLHQPEFATAIAVTHIELAKLLELEQQQGLTGSGILNGQMPLQFKEGELTISNGQINSAPEGGWIRFEPPPEFLAMAQSNPALGIAFDALRNLQYQSLGIQLDYRPEGTALLKTRLQGHNPEWNNGQPVDFTINIEENIPKLIQALQFTDKLTETIEKRYR